MNRISWLSDILDRIKTLLKKEYNKTLPENQKKNSLSQIAGKSLILFFILILIFTVISRSLDSFTIAQITVQKPKRDSLNYTARGTGMIKSAEEAYVNVLAGNRIDKVSVFAGEEVKKGDLLFRYNMEELQNKQDAIEVEIKKLNLQKQQAELDGTTRFNPTAVSSGLSLKQAKENLKIAENNYLEAEEDYQDSLLKTKEELLKDKKEEYREAEKNYDTTIYTYEKELKTSARAVEDAKKALVQANDKVDHINQLIEDYKTAVENKDSAAMYSGKEEIFELFYEGEDGYEDHKSELSAASLAKSRAEDDLDDKEEEEDTILDRYKEAVDSALLALKTAENNNESEENIEALREKYNIASESYSDKKAAFQNEIKTLKRTLDDAKKKYNILKSKDNKLEDYLTAYRLSVEGLLTNTTARDDLYNYLLGENADTIKNDISDKNLTLARTQEDYDALQQEQDRNKTYLKEKLTSLKEIVISMENDTYDYEEAFETKKQAVKTAKEAVRTAKQSLSLNQIQYESAEISDANTAALNEQTAKKADLTVQGYAIDIDSKTKELDKLRKLIDYSGEVKSPYTGTVTTMDLEAGKTTTGEELIKISFGQCIFKAEIDKDSSKYVKTGSKTVITPAGESKGIETEVKSISINSSGTAEFTVKMPKGDYLIGESADYKISNTSDQFNLCIPIQALRSDNDGDYVLVTREQESILGKELIAFRINVEILDKDSGMAAVDGTLSRDDDVIIETDKNVNVNDRVRIRE